MRILMVSHGYPPILSGATLVVQKVARAMEEILRDKGLARQMGAASLRIAQEHAEERTFDRYESLWLETVAEQSTP